jgi:hypothetical protein
MLNSGPTATSHAIDIAILNEVSNYTFVPGQIGSLETEPAPQTLAIADATISKIANNSTLVHAAHVSGYANDPTPLNSTPDYWTTGGAYYPYIASSAGGTGSFGIAAFTTNVEVITGFTTGFEGAYDDYYVLNNRSFKLIDAIINDAFGEGTYFKYVPSFVQDMLRVLKVVGGTYSLLSGEELLTTQESSLLTV